MDTKAEMRIYWDLERKLVLSTILMTANKNKEMFGLIEQEQLALENGREWVQFGYQYNQVVPLQIHCYLRAIGLDQNEIAQVVNPPAVPIDCRQYEQLKYPWTQIKAPIKDEYWLSGPSKTDNIEPILIDRDLYESLAERHRLAISFMHFAIQNAYIFSKIQSPNRLSEYVKKFADQGYQINTLAAQNLVCYLYAADVNEAHIRAQLARLDLFADNALESDGQSLSAFCHQTKQDTLKHKGVEGAYETFQERKSYLGA